MLGFSFKFPSKTTTLIKFMREFGSIHKQFLWHTSTKYTRAANATGGLGRYGSKRKLTNGNRRAEVGGETRSPNAAAAGADGEEVEVVVARLGPIFGLCSNCKTTTRRERGRALRERAWGYG